MVKGKLNTIFKQAFGWNWRLWRDALIKTNSYRIISDNDNQKILEIGAGRFSVLSLCFSDCASSAKVGFYNRNDEVLIKSRILSSGLCKKRKTSFTTEYVDAFNINGAYDIIIMKSVLGGLFRTSDSSLEDVNQFLENLRRNHLNNNGYIISLDNGRSILEIILQNFGARRNDWRYFKLADLVLADEQIGVGVISAFSMSTRLGLIGEYLDTIAYIIDLFLGKLIKGRPTVICSVISKNKIRN